MSEIQARIELLSAEDQLYLAQLIIGGIRKRYFVDHEKADREMEEMANDPGIQRVLRNEDLPYPGAESRAAG
jgi:hypothetical protein